MYPVIPRVGEVYPVIPRVVGYPPYIPRVVGYPPYMPPRVPRWYIRLPICLPVYIAVVHTTNTVMFDIGVSSVVRNINEARVIP